MDDFFGRSWVEAFLGTAVAKQLGERLDGAEFARVRTQVREFYDQHFHLLDMGIVLPPVRATPDRSPSLLQRFAMPDVLIRDAMVDEQRDSRTERSHRQADKSLDTAASNDESEATFRRRDYIRRTSMSAWLADGVQLAVVGDAGSGKSTLLRCIALDVLLQKGVFPQPASRWGNLLPIHVSFSMWSRLSATLGRVASLKDVVSATLQPALTADLESLLNRAIDDRRILLLIDGLDEWSDEQAARQLFNLSWRLL